MECCWLDLWNAFGSVPHEDLDELNESLPLLGSLQHILHDINKDNTMDFVVGKKTVKVMLKSGIRQGDPLSSIFFNLAVEPLIRAAKSFENLGYPIFSRLLKTTAYADDIAVVSTSAEELQEIINRVTSVAADLGFRFNPEKCKCLILINGKPQESTITIDGKTIHCLQPEEQDIYLGTPIGAKLRLRPPTELVSSLDKLAESLLAPWQKL